MAGYLQDEKINAKHKERIKDFTRLLFRTHTDLKPEEILADEIYLEKF